MLGLPCYGAFDIWLCQILAIASYLPEWGAVGQYIDRYAMLTPDLWLGSISNRLMTIAGTLTSNSVKESPTNFQFSCPSALM